MHTRAMAGAALLPLLLLVWEAAAEGHDCAGGSIVEPEPPASLVEHRVTMAKDDVPGREAALTSEDMVTARTGRHEMRTLFETRNSLDEAGNSIELSARFCGLDYPDCGEAAWKPAGLECADVKPVGNQNCTSTEMTEYGLAIGLPSVFWIAVGVTFMVLNALWYLLRCCKLFGGMKAGKGCCCMKCGLPRILVDFSLSRSSHRDCALAKKRRCPLPRTPSQVLQCREGPER